MTIDQTNDLEAIRQLKARYFRLMDTQQWEAWADCFTADVSAFYEGRAPIPSYRSTWVWKGVPNSSRVSAR